jgi:nicotinate-nucleotide pyrophosphorylase (carboxylating)
MSLSTWNTLLAEEIRACGLDPEAVLRIVRGALDEDLGPERLDVTSIATIPASQVDVGDLVARADGVVAGLAVAGRFSRSPAGSRRSRDCRGDRR